MDGGQADLYSDYLRDLGLLLREYAEAAKRQANDRQTEFADGYLSGFHRIISLMQQQGQAFGIPLAALGLEGVDPDEDLV